MNANFIFAVDTTLPAAVELNAPGLVGLAQEVRIVMTTRKGSLPLDRDFGIDFTVIDQPINRVLPVYVAEVARQIEKYVPRVKVLSVEFRPPRSEAVDGVLRPLAKVKVREEYWHEFV
ncbi:hypothetical protein LJC15_00160 [Desulfovibrio sp. OttesenSCG-928-G11]|nr:hypothetical protein [Desulfovibrio sp. OttesenSCG-928-G11]